MLEGACGLSLPGGMAGFCCGGSGLDGCGGGAYPAVAAGVPG